VVHTTSLKLGFMKTLYLHKSEDALVRKKLSCANKGEGAPVKAPKKIMTRPYYYNKGKKNSI
jgi:hypothetical protein